ncbi:hypothetical protein NV104_002643 [Vibrio parahaemolyticus]|nr:hypothetical protein [Vibrio parahaemolyticus]EJS9799261.1 hypothetical protein [Vibrio parahaemolyticus]
MSYNLQIELTANTASYEKRLREAMTDTDRNLIIMERRFDKFANEISKDFTTVNGAINSVVNGLRHVKFGGFIAGAGAVTFAAIGVAKSLNQMGLAAAQNAALIDNAARQANMSVSDFVNASAALGAVGLNYEQLGDISKDVFDKMGDYITTGAGAFQDFFDVVGANTKLTIKDLQGMSSINVFRTMYEEMVRVGASSEQITFVMESMGNEASRLIPLLKDGGKEYDRLVNKMERSRVHLLGSTMEEINSLDASLKAASGNFEVYMSERFVNLTKMFNDFSMSVSSWFNDEAEHVQVKNTVDLVLEGTFAMSSLTDTKKTQEHIDMLEKALSDGQKLWEHKNKYGSGTFAAINSTSLNREEAESQKKREEAIRKHLEEVRKRQEKLKADEAAAGGVISSEGGKSDEAELQRLQTYINNQQLIQEQAVQKQREFIEEEKRLREQAAAEKDQARKAELEAMADQYKNAISIQKSNERLAIAEIKKSEGEKFELENKSHKKRLENAIKFSHDEMSKASANRELALHELEVDIKKGELSEAESVLRKQAIQNEYSKAIKDINQKKLEETRATEDKRLQAALNFAIDGNQKLNAQYQIDLVNLKRALEDKRITQAIYDANIIELNKKKAADEKAVVFAAESDKLRLKRTFATTEAAEREAALEQELLQIEEYRGQDGVSEEMILNKKADIRRKYRAAELEEQLAWMESDAERNVIIAEENLEQLREQLTANQITKDEFRQQELIAETELNEAKRALKYEELGMIADAMSGIHGLAKEGSAAQKILFAAEKAATIAQMSMKMEESAMAASNNVLNNPIHKLSPDGGVTAANAAAMQERIKGGLAIAKVVATSVGQFHGGIDEVPDNASYILKRGERVVQPEANKDLTRFLNESKNGASTGVHVNAPLNIQGDTTISEAKLTAMMAKQRSEIAKLVKVAQRENPSLR